jgi:hypothetical protein
MGRDVQRLLLATVVSLPAFGTGHMLQDGDLATGLRLALGTCVVVLLAAAIAHSTRRGSGDRL